MTATSSLAVRSGRGGVAQPRARVPLACWSASCFASCLNRGILPDCDAMPQTYWQPDMCDDILAGCKVGKVCIVGPVRLLVARPVTCLFCAPVL